jgi:hypothetical protein
MVVGAHLPMADVLPECGETPEGKLVHRRTYLLAATSDGRE